VYPFPDFANARVAPNTASQTSISRPPNLLPFPNQTETTNVIDAGSDAPAALE
jgi:hypothetical protein